MWHPPEKPRQDDKDLGRLRREFGGQDAQLAEAARAWHPQDREYHLNRKFDPERDV
jgi:hypothetical protein